MSRIHWLTSRGKRIAVTLLPLVLAVLHTLGWTPMPVLEHLDDIIYDARLRTTMPRSLDARIVIVDIDEKSLQAVGRWPWPRDRVAELVDRLFEQPVALLGFDTVFTERDNSSGLTQLQALASGALADQPGFAERVRQLQPELDHDARLARALAGRPVVLGYYFTSDRDGRRNGSLPQPVAPALDPQGLPVRVTTWDGHGANLAQLTEAAPHAGFFNSMPDADGVVRAAPLVAEHGGRVYESLALAMFRQLLGSPQVELGAAPGARPTAVPAPLHSVRLTRAGQALAIPVDGRGAALVPFRGRGGPAGGSFVYVSASDVLSGAVGPERLKNKIVLLGTTAPGAFDLRATPVGETYPGVEAHANLLAGLLDGQIKAKPDYAAGLELVLLVLTGLLLAFGLPRLNAARAALLYLAVVAVVVGLNSWLYMAHDLVLPLASVLVMTGAAFVLNMSYGYGVESRSKRELAQLFGTYVPPALVEEMVKDPARYSMAAQTRELTVLFCDMRGFTQLAETMEPLRLQELLNAVFSRLTHIIRAQQGTIDKYMGDCVMAFWGAPVAMPDHASRAVHTALLMVREVEQINRDHAAQGLPTIGVGVGLTTGDMCVGDMGSDVRRSYTVVGDVVNLGARLEALSRTYGVDIVASDATRQQVDSVVWQEIDRVQVKGKAQAVGIHTPWDVESANQTGARQELVEWAAFLPAWYAQQWAVCHHHLANLLAQNEEKFLYRLYKQRVALRASLDRDSSWDGVTRFDSK